MNRNPSILVAFNGSLLYNVALSAVEQALSLVDIRSIGNSRLEFVTNDRVLLQKEFPTKNLLTELSRLQVTVENITAYTFCQLALNGQRIDWLSVMPLYSQGYHELNPETTKIAFKATPLAQFNGPYTWLRYRLPSREFYIELHNQLSERILAFYNSVPPSAAKQESFGRERLQLAGQAFNFQRGSVYETTQLWSPLLFGFSRSQFPSDTEFYEAISQANQPRRFWEPALNRSSPKQWLIQTILSSLIGTTVNQDVDELTYRTWVLLLRINLFFSSSIRNAEYELISTSRRSEIEFESRDRIQGTFMCLQSGNQAPVLGLQYFPTIPINEMLFLRRIDNVLQLPDEKSDIKTKFSYGTTFKLPGTKHYVIDTSPSDTVELPELFRSGLSLSGEASRSFSIPVAGRLGRGNELPRTASYSGDYYRVLRIPPGTHEPFGGTICPTQVRITSQGQIIPEQPRKLAELVSGLLQQRIEAFRYRVDTETRRQLNQLLDIRLNANEQFPVPLPVGSTLEWSVFSPESGLRVLYEANDQLGLDLPGEEESAGVYRLEVNAPATATEPALKNEVLTFYLDFQLDCQRCGTGFSVMTNDHGSCQFHARKPTSLTNPDQGLLSLHTFNPERDVETVDSLLHGAIRLNPNVFWGVGQSSQGGEEYWLCCGRLLRKPGCYVGRHSAVNSGPDLCDWLHNGPRRGTEWQLDTRTSSENFAAIVKAYTEARFIDGVNLEWQFNSVHGGVISPTFRFKQPKSPGQDALERLLREGFYANDQIVDLLYSEVDFIPSFGLWKVDRSAQLAYQLGAPSSSGPPTVRAERATALVRVFRVLRNLPIENPQRLDEARRVIVLRWLTLGRVPDQTEANQFAVQETAVFARLTQRILAILDAVHTELVSFERDFAQLNRQVEALRVLIYQQVDPEEYALRFQYNVLVAETEALKLPFTRSYWTSQRIRLEFFLRQAFFNTNNEETFRRIYEPRLIALETGRPVAFGAAQSFEFGTADQIEDRRQRVVALELAVNVNLTNLQKFLQEDATRRQQSITLAADFETQLNANVKLTGNQLERIASQQLAAQNQAIRGYPAELGLLEKYRRVWQRTDPGYFAQLYQAVDLQKTVLESVSDRTLLRANVLQLMGNNQADMSRILGRILNNTLQELPPAQLQDLLDDLRQLSFTTTVADSLAYTGTLLRDAEFNGADTRLSNFFRAMDNLTTENGFHSLPRVERASVQLQERWTQLRGAFNLQLLDEQRVLSLLPSNPSYASRIDGVTTRSELLQFYEQLMDKNADLSAASPAQQRLLQQISIGSGNVVYLTAIKQWTDRENIRAQWLDELRSALENLSQSQTDFLTSVIRAALGAENDAALTALIARAAVPAILEYIRANPSEIPAVWVYLNTNTPPTDQDLLVQRLANTQRERRLIEIDNALALLPDIPWQASADFAAYRGLVQQIQIPPAQGLPDSSWFVRWYLAETKLAAFPNPNVRGYLNVANALLDLLCLPILSAYAIRSTWQSTRIAQLARLQAMGEPAASWIARFKQVYTVIALSTMNPNFQTAMLTTVASLNDSTVVLGSQPRRRWQYLHWGTEFKALLASSNPSPILSIQTLNRVYFEGNPPAERPGDSMRYLLLSELARSELDQLRIGRPASATPASARAQAGSARWLYHQLLRGDNDPIAFLVMAVLLAGTSTMKFDGWVLINAPATRRVLELVKVIDQELKATDLSPIQPALNEMRANPRPQSVGISYRRPRDGRTIELAGSPFLLRPIWPMSNPLARAWFTVLSYAFEKSDMLKKLRSADHTYLLEFLASVCHIYMTGTPVGQAETQLYDYLEGVCDSLDPKKPDALAYFVHAFALHPVPGSGRSGDMLASRLIDRTRVERGFLLSSVTPESWAMSLDESMGLKHLVLRPTTDPFDLAAAIGSNSFSRFQLWLTLSGAANPDAERTRLPFFINGDKQAFVLYKSNYEKSRPFYNDTEELSLLETDTRHSLFDVNAGTLTRDRNGNAEFSRAVGVDGTLVLELTPSLEVYWTQHQRNLSSLREHIQTVQAEIYSVEASSVESNVELAIQRDYSQSSILTVFFAKIQTEQIDLVARIDASPSARLVPVVAAKLKELVSRPFFERQFAPLLPDSDKLAIEIRDLHANNRNYTAYTAAVIQILIQRLEMSAGSLAPIQRELTALWDVIKNIVDNTLVHVSTQTAGLVAAVEPAQYQVQLQDLDVKLRTGLSANLATFDYAEFVRQLTDIQTVAFVDIPFINKAKLDDVQQRLTGGSIASNLQSWGGQVNTSLDNVMNELQQLLIRGGKKSSSNIPAISTPSLSLPSFRRPMFTLTASKAGELLSDLYMALFFRAWYTEAQLDSPALKDGFDQGIAPRIEMTARELLIWCERTGFWQDADAILVLAVLARDLAILTSPARIFNALKLPSTPTMLAASNLSAITPPLDPQILNFDAKYVGQAGFINALSERVSDVFKPKFQTLIRVFNSKADWFSNATQMFTEYIQSARIQPQYSLPYLPEMQLAVNALPVGSIFTTDTSAMHQLVDNWIRPTLATYTSGMKSILTNFRNPLLSRLAGQRVPRPLAISRTLDLSRNAFLPLLISQRFLDRLETTRIHDLCVEIAEYEADNSIQILSSRWPTPQFDAIRGRTNLWEFGRPTGVNLNNINTIMAAQKWDNLPPVGDYRPMFFGDPEVARRLESLFHFGVDTLSYAEIRQRYEQNFQNNPAAWVRYRGGEIPNEIPKELLDIIDQSGQSRATVLHNPQSMLQIAIRPYIGLLRGRRLRERYLRDIVALGLSRNPLPVSLKALSMVQSRGEDSITPPPELVARWREQRNDDNAFATLIATTDTPTSPWGLDLYLVVSTVSNTTVQWAIFENRFSTYAQPSNQCSIRFFPTDGAESRFLLLRGMVDARELDGKTQAISELEHQINTVSNQVHPESGGILPGVYNPVTSSQLRTLSRMGFYPTFPYLGRVLGNRVPVSELIGHYRTRPSVGLQVVEPATASVLRSQSLFYTQIFEVLSDITDAFEYPNVAIELAQPPPQPLIPWLNPIVLPGLNGRPVMLRDDLTTL